MKSLTMFVQPRRALRLKLRLFICSFMSLLPPRAADNRYAVAPAGKSGSLLIPAEPKYVSPAPYSSPQMLVLEIKDQQWLHDFGSFRLMCALISSNCFWNELKCWKKRSNVLSGIIILLYNGDSVNGVTSPVLVLLGDPPAVLLVLLSVLILFKFEEGVEISMDSPAQFKIAAVEAPSTLSALCVIKRISPSSRLWRGGVRFSVAPFTLGVLRAVERVSPSG